MGAFYAGNRVNVLDICPNYTASLLGLVNGLGAIGGIIVLFSTGLLTPNVHNGHKHFINFVVMHFFQASKEEWRVVFWITLSYWQPH